MTDIQKVLTARGNRHGPWKTQAKVASDLKHVVRATPNWDRLPAPQKEALDSIMVKVSRILTGEALYPDHWVDINGYAKLGLDTLPDTECVDKE